MILKKRASKALFCLNLQTTVKHTIQVCAAHTKLINSTAAALTNAGENMTIQCALKTLLFSVLWFFYQQGLANDIYDLEAFREHYKTNSNPPSNNLAAFLGQNPLENIRIGFVRLNLTSDELSGDGRFETLGDYEVNEQDFRRLGWLYFNYVHMADTHDKKIRSQRMLRLIHHIFTININQINARSPDNKRLISVAAQSLFEHFL
ncbi:hypothetical protein [Endozoicomonas sp. 4G]|uniref:hypothetical protein n=1 Tax=Endozoicomonas sp. 4G TaxID=2872754 RepID=UPI002078BEF3|nr:hypothetical protein [Endozoicomonas sp. 4G]